MSELPETPDSSKSPEGRAPAVATMALIFGLLSLVTGFIFGIPAIICGHISLVKIRKSGLEKGYGSAVIGMILGYVMTVFAPPILFFGASKAMTSAKKADALNTAYNLRNGLAAYHTEYRQSYPDVGIGGFAYTDEKFMAGLSGADTEYGRKVNPRCVAFFLTRIATQVGDGKWQRGVSLDKRGTGSLWDSWGNLYRVTIKPGSDGFDSILVWSPGPDGKDDTKDDLRTD